MTHRQFHRTVIQVEVLSESPIGPVELDTVHHLITQGDCSGHVQTVLQEELNGKQAAQALLQQGSDPSFFQLTTYGNDTE
jgi:hypothetical protein